MLSIILIAKSFVRLILPEVAGTPLHFERRRAVESSFTGFPATFTHMPISVRTFGNRYNLSRNRLLEHRALSLVRAKGHFPKREAMVPARGAAPMIMDEVRMIKESLLTLLFPPSCAFCDAIGASSSTGLCQACEVALKPVPQPICQQCGFPRVGLSAHRATVCGRCLSSPPPYERARFGFLYSGGLREAIVRFKYGNKLYLGFPLGALLIQAFYRYFTVTDYELLVPVPVHRKRLLGRGFNQSLLIAESLARATGIPLDRCSFHKVRDTPPQVGLPRAERLNNLRGCFEVVRPLKVLGKRILVIDDVTTTGSTIAEATKTLLAAGAAQADALALALRSESAEVRAPHTD